MNNTLLSNLKVEEDKSWNHADTKELLMHRIHAYPAKFPAFLTPRIIEHLTNQGKTVHSIVDIFCGCGTSALESRILGIDYVGYDINPVATLIAKTKSEVYDKRSLDKYYHQICQVMAQHESLPLDTIVCNERIQYWFDPAISRDLYVLLHSIKTTCPRGKYRNFFLTAFSNILKSCSRWLTKSIKPQIDPMKKPAQPSEAFRKQVDYMVEANEELKECARLNSKVAIKTGNVLTIRPSTPFADLLITSPPYVTSYEYADLHQLSTLWLGYVEDYRDLRKGTIGSEFHTHVKTPLQVNAVGQHICEKLKQVDKAKSRAIKKYFHDINQMVVQTRNILHDHGNVAFVIGNTSYKDVYIDNAQFLITALSEHGFSHFQIMKRQISSKILTPYRDNLGRFSNNTTGKKVYSHEYLILAEKVA